MSSVDTADTGPFVDEIQTRVSAPAVVVWRTLTHRFSGVHHDRNLALGHLLGAEPRRPSGTFPERGATLPGFQVTESVPGKLLELTGRHRFSRYRLVLTLAEQAGETVVSARTYARFPGPHGAAYRMLVIGSGGHHLAVNALLRDVRRRAENPHSPTQASRDGN
jgi:hypothetical protein